MESNQELVDGISSVKAVVTKVDLSSPPINLTFESLCDLYEQYQRLLGAPIPQQQIRVRSANIEVAGTGPQAALEPAFSLIVISQPHRHFTQL